MAQEARDSRSSRSTALAAFHVCEKLGPPLATLAGNIGFRALLSRALALASDEVPWLRTVHVEDDGSLGGLDGLEARVSPKELADGEVVLLAHLLGLLLAFIGEDLTLRLTREVWPKVSLSDMTVAKRSS